MKERARTRAKLAPVALAIFGVVASLMSAPTTAQAINGSDFNPEMIIADEVFYNYSSMSPNDIQLFLNSRVAQCQSGYVCLKDYAQDTPQFGGDQYCSGLNGGVDSAAVIIWEVAQSCHISPRVLLVLLEKEQSLVSSRAPSPGKYNAATGFSCPDTAPCDPAFAGFVYQVYYAARQFNRYAANPSSYGYRAGRTSEILYSPNSACGTRTVFVRNQATANLYIYTPYTPNAAALDNLYGTGDACSSYGNRNFWRIFTDWFGSTITNATTDQAISLVRALYTDVLGRSPDPSGLSTWPGYLLYANWNPGMVATAILSSDEYYSARIADAYRTVLGREPDPTGAADWLAWMRNGAVSVDAIASTFTRSDEYYAQSGSNPEEFVRRLYLTMVGRPAGDTEVVFWANAVHAFGFGAVADAIYNSDESGRLRVNRVYQAYLKRDVDPSGLITWVPIVVARGDQIVRSQIVSSFEYYLTAQTRFPPTV